MAFTISHFSLFCFLTMLALVQAQHVDLLLTVVNNCPFTIWPAILPNNGFPVLEKGGFRLTTLATRSFSISNTTQWAGRIWARTGCAAENGQFSCATGDCGGSLECNGLGGQVPATLGEFSIHHNAYDHSSYTVSLVDGFNLPMTITPHQGTGVCPVVGCRANLLDNCLDPLKFRGSNNNGPVVGCNSGCLAFNTDELCCRNAFSNPQKCHASTYSNFFKQACHDTSTYPYDSLVNQKCASPGELKVIFCH